MIYERVEFMKKFSKCMRKMLSVFLTMVVVIGVITVAPISASAMTNQQGADWALARVGGWIDTDGYYGAQCKDFVNAFTQENFGVTFPGNACDLITCSLPSGWQRIQNYAEFLPQPGDIAVWGAWSGNPYGHTGIIVSANLMQFDSVDQNWYNSSSNGSAAARVTHNYTSYNFWGVIRPPYQSAVPSVSGTWITVSNSTFISGSTVTFNLGANHAQGYTIGINKDGTRVITQGVGTNPSFTITEPGNYSAYVTSYNSVSNQDSNIVNFRVVSPENLGSNFYGIILNTEHWKPIGATDDNNVVLQTETGIAGQLWKFERQSDFTYEIKNTKNGHNLDVLNFGTENGTNIQLCPDNNSSAQRWYIVRNGNGYNFIPQCAINSVMDLANGGNADNTNIWLYENNNTVAQIFSIYKEDSIQLKGSNLSVTVNENENYTVFDWSETYGENEYHLNIWNDNATEGELYYNDNSIAKNTLSAKLELPPGYYEARVDAVNYFECKNSNIVSFTVPGFIYTTQDEKKILTKYYGDDSKIVISDDVTDIEASAFEGKSNISELTIGNHVQVVGENAFLNCQNLKSVYIPNSVTTINSYAFGYEFKDDMYNVVSDFTVYSHANSVAEKYAEENGLKYVDLTKYYIAGDVDQNGIVNRDDAELLVKALAGKTMLTDIQKLLTDVNQDSCININDANTILRFTEGKDSIGYAGTVNELDENFTLIVGDVDKNFKIDSNDIELLVKAITEGKVVDFTNEQKIVSDVTLDDRINMVDVYAINKFINVEDNDKYIGTSIILPDNITLDENILSMNLGDTYELIATLTPNNATTICTWSSSNTAVATVDSNGKITAVGIGTATITVTTRNGKTANCVVTVVENIGDINNDGSVSKADMYAWTVIYANQSGTPPTEYQLAVGDLNGNGKYDIPDKMLLNKLIA